MAKSLKNIPHDSAFSHVSGKSEFIDDRPPMPGELQLTLLLSERAHADFRIENLDEARQLPGIHGIFTAKDFHHNLWGTILQDQPLLAESRVQYCGEAIAIIAADSMDAATAARKFLKIQYQELPAILSISEARKKQSFIGFERCIERGHLAEALKKAPRRLRGSVDIRGAEHFYLEPQCALAYPIEGGRLEIYSSTQHPTEVQHVVSHGLGLQSHDVVVVVKRMGGGFGGKESQSAPIAAYAALVAHKCSRPARIVLSREDDMILTGKRNPFYNEYEVAFDEKGSLLALDLKLFSDAGAYADLSTSIMERAMLHSDSAYYIPNIRVVGRVCRTNMQPHTAFRGFGAPKGVIVVERIIEEIASLLGIDALEIRKRNCYQASRNLTHYGQRLQNNCLPELFKRLEKTSDYKKRRQAIDRFNENSLENGGESIRGLSLTPVKFGISFTTRFLNQGNALVNVYRDGSVQVSTGATEMGQGVYRRIGQIVADELGIPLSQVRVMPTSTEKNANTSPTAASSGTDINGAAAALACQQIKGRLAELAVKLLKLTPHRWPSKTASFGTEDEIKIATSVKRQSLAQASKFKEVEFRDGRIKFSGTQKKSITFSDLCNEAYLNRLSLCEYAHYAIPGLGFDKVKGQGKGAFLYYTQGVACSEISLNRLTGEMKILRSDILMDLGRSVNRELDLGQIAGAFIQGSGWLSLERLHYSKDGALKSLGPSTYKIPAIHDIPREWNIDLLPNEGNLVNVRATKAVGEPPLLLAISVWTAMHDALRYQRKFVGQPFAQLNVPADGEALLKALYPDDFETFEAMK